MNNPYIPHASFQPSHIALFYMKDGPNYSSRGGELIPNKIFSNTPKRFIQPNGVRKIKRAVNWLYELAEPKQVWNDKRKVFFSFKLNFITLTLPALQMHTDKTIKNVALNNFLTDLRKYQKVNNYVWRAECQQNGNIHFHIITDTYINYNVIRKIWNRQMSSLGYIDRYSKKFGSLSFKDYCKIVDPEKKKDLSRLSQSYSYGQKTRWKDPNSTDIHSLTNIVNPAAYISKYLTKSECTPDSDGRYSLSNRRIEGRKYGISRKLGRIKGFIDIKSDVIDSIIDYAVKDKKKKVFYSDWYSIVCISFKDWKGHFIDYYKEILKSVIDSVSYLRGGVGKDYYRLIE